MHSPATPKQAKESGNVTVFAQRCCTDRFTDDKFPGNKISGDESGKKFEIRMKRVIV
jgi:hypothetical protein